MYGYGIIDDRGIKIGLMERGVKVIVIVDSNGEDQDIKTELKVL